MDNWGFNLRKLREELGYSQTELARLWGEGISNVGHMERGRYDSLKQSKLIKLAKIANMSTSELSIRLFGKPSDQRMPFAGSDLVEDDLSQVVMLRLRGSIPAGSPAPEEEELTEEYVPIPKILLKGASAKVYALRVIGNSLSGDGINKGDMVAVDPEAPIIDGKIYALRIENEVVARHMARSNGTVRLSSSNGDYKDIELSHVEILGRIIGRVNVKKF